MVFMPLLYPPTVYLNRRIRRASFSFASNLGLLKTIVFRNAYVELLSSVLFTYGFCSYVFALRKALALTETFSE